ncbi:DUF2252 domain-containing protein [Aetokthonos hydrillicola Thurmond2011]|jgi:uncharacterized protein (DUF2252 family)|uniref:DUF2252 domain-containing protein n=1 Tax=Aetokthonos hydrillicola Thurmond2011 TaxID=2712845 RepID=A0AAP5IEN6_9CYAN|nr:DUF2252 domain-containing protein [Aetokthonos hydrillicola]MBO3460716.1 DUF2252 domain-containing protein [Aetokthonos hydrillicola CCALA 1050]MBW4586427.1 DUF2252 domain-containing protein [Aetokthonos hydrillicola CCALA 1050]MDR9899864.1 DUF2252 domain-containing protein [Aetokthonos hydrillicola Thurmond2011]
MLKQLSKNFCVLLLTLAFASTSQAATPRSSWVQNEIYQYNHPYASQLPQELATKMQKMTASPFAFYRGTDHIFYRDMSTLPSSQFVNSSTSAIWLEGDMHMQNLGGMRDSNDNNVFDTTDFDEGYLGPYVWDLRRMAVSILLAAKENGLSSADAQDIVRNFLDAYLNKMSDFKGTNDELSYRLEQSNTSGVVKDLIQKAAGQSRSNLLNKYTQLDSSSHRVFQTTSELQSVSSTTYSAIAAAMSSYIASIPSSKRYSNSYYTLKDIRLKLGSGTGSLGKYRYYVLIEGPSTANDDDRILEMKQEGSSAVAIAAPSLLPSSVYDGHEGKRVTIATKAMLSNTDPLVGYTTVNSIPFWVHEKSPYQVDFDYKLLTTKSKFMDAMGYAGKVVAKNHAISDQDYDSTIVSVSVDKQVTDITSGNKGAFKDEIVNFALDYATQVEYDYTSFVNAYNQGVTLY